MQKSLLGVAILIIVVAGIFLVLQTDKNLPEENYNPTINPQDFSIAIDNPYFTLIPGTTFVYEAQKPEGRERIEVTVLEETRVVMGVETRVVKDQVFLDGELIEDTLDWYAQDREGNVWYFGEETAEYENGTLTTRHGSWEAGVDGAKPGIIMKANPQVGDSYWQEMYKGEAEDRADVLALGETVAVPHGTFSECLKTYDYTPLDPNAKEHKYYCKGVGQVTLEVNIEDNERTELISVTRAAATGAPSPLSGTSQTTPPSQTPPPPSPTSSLVSSEINEIQARAIAIARISGTVTDIGIETKLGKRTYVVEVKPSNGAEVDVIIDIHSGEILAVEN